MKILSFLLLSFIIIFYPSRVFAVEDPAVFTNNTFGVHILFPEELEMAAKLVNSNGGDWGYVTIPIQSTDRNLEKWQKFMDEAKRLHVIPIIRIATYPKENLWTKPTIFDHLDFANFLNSLYWPTKNRYIVVYNEPNSNLEWGGEVNAKEYAIELSRTIDAFKRVNSDFFIISAGLDSHAPDRGTAYQNSFAFLRAMDDEVPGIFRRIDGFASHSYPNSNFTENPAITRSGGVLVYREELAFLRRFGREDIPIFITETGWEQSRVSEERAALFLRFAFEQIWKEPNIVAITPFVLNGAGSAFSGFSLLQSDGTPTKIFEEIASLPKLKGRPQLNFEGQIITQSKTESPSKKFNDYKSNEFTLRISQPLRTFLKWLFY